MKGNITMKSSKRSNGKKVNLNLKALMLNKAHWYLLGACLWFPWPIGDGLHANHNEMFLADLS
jgi:hypothetical protein